MTVHPEQTPPLTVIAAHILEQLDSVEAQLATIRSWAELLIAKKHEEADAGGGH